MTTRTEPATTLERLAIEKDWVEKDWNVLLDTYTLAAQLGEWEETDSLHGPLLSARVSGEHAAQALLQCAASHAAVLDYDRPGRISCAWRSNGVWLELWHPDPIDDLEPADSTPVSRAARRAALLRRGRLPFTRRKKETTRT